MIYKEFPIHPELKPYVQVIWMMEAEASDDEYAKEQIMPDGILEFITHYRSPWFVKVYGKEQEKQPDSFVISQMKKSIEIESDGATGFVSVRFYPWGAYHFMDQNVALFLDDHLKSEEIWKDDYHVFKEQFDEGSDEQQRVQLIQDFLLQQFRKNRKQNTAFDKAVKMIRESNGQMPIAEICKQTELNKKQLERLFSKWIGTTPKSFARISRFLNLCHHLDDYGNKNLTDLAYDCGYFDQSHFIKEFKQFSGYTPRDFFLKNNVSFADR